MSRSGVTTLEDYIMRDLMRSLSAAFVMALFVALPGSAAENPTQHRVAMHVDQNDPDVMNLALNNAKNVIEHYQKRGEDVVIEIVAYSGGLHMLRADTSQVKDRIKEMVGQYSARIKFAACNNTMQGMEKREGHAISIIPEATVVSSGVVELVELQEQGWSYIRP